MNVKPFYEEARRIYINVFLNIGMCTLFSLSEVSRVLPRLGRERGLSLPFLSSLLPPTWQPQKLYPILGEEIVIPSLKERAASC
jgi:hypothetical protein